MHWEEEASWKDFGRFLIRYESKSNTPERILYGVSIKSYKKLIGKEQEEEASTDDSGRLLIKFQSKIIEEEEKEASREDSGRF